jgi:hypothetical protein
METAAMHTEGDGTRKKHGQGLYMAVWVMLLNAASRGGAAPPPHTRWGAA